MRLSFTWWALPVTVFVGLFGASVGFAVLLLVRWSAISSARRERARRRLPQPRRPLR